MVPAPCRKERRATEWLSPTFRSSSVVKGTLLLNGRRAPQFERLCPLWLRSLRGQREQTRFFGLPGLDIQASAIESQSSTFRLSDNLQRCAFG